MIYKIIQEERQTMAMKKKRVLGLLLGLVLMLLGMSMTVYAAETTEYDLWVGGTQVTSANASDVLVNDPANAGKVSFTPASDGNPATLTLNGASISGGGSKSAAIYAGVDLGMTINVTADSTVTCPGNGVYSYESLTVTGTGTLTAVGGAASSGNSYGVWANGAVTVNGTLVARGGTAYYNSCGVYAEKAVTVNKGGTLTAEGGAASNDYCSSTGVWSTNGDIFVAEGGTLTGIGDAANYASYGVFAADGAVTVNGRLTAAGRPAKESRSVGVRAKAVTVNGTLEARGDTANINSAGILALTLDEHKSSTTLIQMYR